MRLAMLAPPWIDMPPRGYGGIEWIAHWLTEGLRDRGVEVELFATGDSSTAASRRHSLYERGQYEHIGGPLFDNVAIPIAHVAYALSVIADDGQFDLIHDHNGFLGPAMAAFAGGLPPMLHTLHAPFTSAECLAAGWPDNREALEQLAQGGGTWFNGISRSQVRSAPPGLQQRIVAVVHNAVDVEAMPFCPQPAGHMLCLARICADKAQAVAARACIRHGQPLVIAGAVAGLGDLDSVQRRAASGSNVPPDVDYFVRELLPLLDGELVRWVGSVSGEPRMRLLSTARALLFPIDWEEPFGLAVIEALACGTPVVAMRRGAMAELVDHGVTGFLAGSTREFERYVGMVDQIDRAACRASAWERFRVTTMVDAYLDAYERVLEAARAPRRVAVGERPARWFGTRRQPAPDTQQPPVSTRG